MARREGFGSGWSLRAAEADPAIPAEVFAALPIPATVPGTVHTDLLAAGLIPDPYLDRNEELLTWIGEVDWLYERTFDHTPAEGEEVVLCFEGLDTVATVAVNGQVLLRSANMHRRYEVDLAKALVEGSNDISVRFDSAIAAARAEVERLGDLPRQYPLPYNFIRKSACNFGWDWGPTLVGAGIWRDVTLVRSLAARIRSASPATTMDGDDGVVHLPVHLAGRLDRPTTIVVTVGSGGDVIVESVSLEAGADHLEFEVRVPNVRRWWPRDLGSPDLYDVSVQLFDGAAELDHWEGRVGFRTFRLDTEPDAQGMPFVFVVNDVRLPIRGVNWIPDDCFFPRATAGRVRERLGQAVDANVNLIRIWGGGAYESAAFYEACDEAGLLVWQDFLFACAAYPEEERHAVEVDAEARDNVDRLRPHPSLVLWNGNNENFEGYLDWDWQEGIGDRAWGPGYYLDVLPRAVAETDPTRPYWPGSPYSGSPSLHPNDNDHGPRHIWDAWNKKDYSVYAEYRPRFVAEFGWQGPPTYATLTAAIHDDPLTPDAPGLVAHQKAEDGVAKLEQGVRWHFADPKTFDDWLYAAQVVQSRAVCFGIEHFRSLWPRTAGTVLWQLNDCWPVVSWAMVDGAGRRKPLWYGVRRSFAPRLLTFQEIDGELALVAVNDTIEDWSSDVTLQRVSFDGSCLAATVVALRVSSFSTTAVMLSDGVRTPAAANRELLVADAGPARALHFFVPDLDLELDAVHFELSIEREGPDHAVTLTSDTVARDVAIFADRLEPDATVDEQLVTLLPGEPVVFRLSGVLDGDLERAGTAAVLRCANDLVGPSTFSFR